MGKYTIRYTEIAGRDLSIIKNRDEEFIPKIIAKIDFCLGEHLFDHIRQCNKKKLRGKKNTHRLHVQRRYTVFYTILDVKQKKYVEVHMVMDLKQPTRNIHLIDL